MSWLNYECFTYMYHWALMLPLFSSFKLSEPSLWGLEALCALGLLQSDVTLATAVQEELFKHGGADDHMTEIMLLNNVLNMQKVISFQAFCPTNKWEEDISKGCLFFKYHRWRSHCVVSLS